MLRRGFWMRALGLTAAGLVSLLIGFLVLTDLPGDAQAQEPDEGGLPPLVIDRSLTLEDSAEEDSSHLKINQSCFVCHNNYQKEPMTTWHAKEGVGCVDCHGKSLAHRNDEDNITPPDIMYPAEKIDEACQECHDEHIAWPRDVLSMWQERCPEKTDFSQLVCTDCHGEHRLPRRIVRWDKRTGKLIVRKPQEGAAATGQESRDGTE